MEKPTAVAVDPHTRRSSAAAATLLTVIVVVLLTFFRPYTSLDIRPKSVVDKVQQCAINNLHKDLSFLDGANPITADEFVDRRDRLARGLVEANVDAFVLEPGYTFQQAYYANVSQQDWEPWEPEERPFLMLILPQTDPTTGTITAHTAFLAPHFEEARVRMLGIPTSSSSPSPLDIVVWEEHWNPYTTLRNSHLFSSFSSSSSSQPTLMIDDELRDFISRGLETSANFRTTGLHPAAARVRQLKSPAEVALLRAVNSGTVSALRAMRPCLVPGLTEDEVRDTLDAALRSVPGFGLFFNIVLAEEHGALPHGGVVTGRKRIGYESMVVIDVGAHYRGYSSDVCRSFFIDPPPAGGGGLMGALFGWWWTEAQWRPSDPELHAEKLKVWDIVFEAQTAAAKAFKPNATAASVDIAARTVIEDAGYGYGFTHRVGHGIGIKAHESPYLNKFNTEELLEPGMTFTNEPGIYLENRFGVRHEDIFLVTESGEAELLSGRRAQGPYDP